MDNGQTHDYLNSFESFGANCEFGFVQERCNVNFGTIFRWAEIASIQTLINLVKSKFTNLYALENLSPFNAGMVVDTSIDVAWHSVLRSQIIDPKASPAPENFRFIQPEEERRRLWGHEIGKVRFLMEKTLKGLTEGNRIYVYKPLRKNIILREDLERLHSAVTEYGNNAVLYVTVAGSGEVPGDVEVIHPGLLHGYVDRFAPGNNARDVSIESWTTICQRAYLLSQEHFLLQKT